MEAPERAGLIREPAFLPERVAPPQAHRTAWALLLVGLVIGLELVSLYSVAQMLGAPTAGLVYQPSPSREPRAIAATDAAAWAVRSLGPEVFVREVNGHAPVLTQPFRSPFEAFVQRELGATNHFVLEDRAGKRADVVIAVDRANLFALLRETPEAIAFPLVGLVYLVFGMLVFFRRPLDRASLPLLVFSCVAGVHMSFNLHLTPGLCLLGCLREVVAPLYAPSLVNLGLQFTGMHAQPRPRKLLRLISAIAFSMLFLSAYVWLVGVSPSGERAYRIALTSLLVLSVLVTVGISFAAARPPHALGLRRRARVLGVATFAAFLVPSLSLLWTDLGGYWIVVVGLLACFPIMLAYAIARLGMFDMKLVLGQGLVYVSLSIGLLLGYVGLVFLVIRVLGANADRPFVFVATLLASVLVLSLIQLRVQGVINRVVFRSRYVLGDALAQASRQLSRARSRREVIETARSALLDAMQLTRAAVAVAEPESLALRCTVLGNRPDPRTFELPTPLPERLDPARLSPIARALRSREMVSAHDSEAVSAPLDEELALFWQRYGLEWMVPMSLGMPEGGERVLGLLMLGPKQDGRALDASDRALLSTLAAQLAVAIEGADAFEQIRALKESLQAQVEERTRDLSEALGDLQRMQSHLIEAEKQAVLGRLAAGIVHEINSPLGSLRSAVDTTGRLLTRVQPYLEAPATEGDAEAKRLLSASGESGNLVRAMRQSGERIEALVTGLKRFVSLDQGHRKRLDVREGLDGAINLLAPALAERICVTRSYPELAPHVECDPARLNQVFLSVLENAVRACDDGGGQIHIAIAHVNAHVDIQVRDSGRGIAPERIAGLFDVGFTRKEGRVAMRLGLPSSKHAIEELGGTIAITSEEGRGTLVRIALPLAADS